MNDENLTSKESINAEKLILEKKKKEMEKKKENPKKIDDMDNFNYTMAENDNKISNLEELLKKITERDLIEEDIKKIKSLQITIKHIYSSSAGTPKNEIIELSNAMIEYYKKILNIIIYLLKYYEGTKSLLSDKAYNINFQLILSDINEQINKKINYEKEKIDKIYKNTCTVYVRNDDAYTYLADSEKQTELEKCINYYKLHPKEYKLIENGESNESNDFLTALHTGMKKLTVH